MIINGRQVGSFEIVKYSFELIDDNPKIVISMIKASDTNGKYIKFIGMSDAEPYLSKYPVTFKSRDETNTQLQNRIDTL